MYLLKISRIHPAIMVTLPLPLWHLRSMVSAWEGRRDMARFWHPRSFMGMRMMHWWFLSPHTRICLASFLLTCKEKVLMIIFFTEAPNYYRATEYLCECLDLRHLLKIYCIARYYSIMFTICISIYYIFLHYMHFLYAFHIENLDHLWVFVSVLVLLFRLMQESVVMNCNLLKQPGFFEVSSLVVYSHSTSFISALDN